VRVIGWFVVTQCLALHVRVGVHAQPCGRRQDRAWDLWLRRGRLRHGQRRRPDPRLHRRLVRGVPGGCQSGVRNGCAVAVACVADGWVLAFVGICMCSPSDAAKIEAGACGCGVADTDADGDLTPDCNDGWYVVCTTAVQLWPACVAGGGEIAHLFEHLCVRVCTRSPSDATKTAPGACGCGVADTDADGDSNPDCTDGWYVGCSGAR
jgi:hypothetical protein